MAYSMRALVEEIGEMGQPIRFTASTAGVKRDGKSLEVEDWKLENYRSNPVVLWGHDYGGQRLPIGRAEVWVEGEALKASVMFDPEDEFAQAVEGKYRRKFLNAVSVGWLESRDGKRTSLDLLDISAVPVPGDADALMEREYRALGELMQRESEDWPETARQMAQVFLSWSEDDEARLRVYQGLLPKYRRLGRTAPEFLPAQQLAVLEEADIRGLFLEGEGDYIEQRAGAVLAARNRADLEQAVTLIRAVLERAAKETTGEEQPRAQAEEPGREVLALAALSARLALSGI